MYNTKNKYEQGQALRKEIYMYVISYFKLFWICTIGQRDLRESRRKQSYHLETFKPAY